MSFLRFLHSDHKPDDVKQQKIVKHDPVCVEIVYLSPGSNELTSKTISFIGTGDESPQACYEKWITTTLQAKRFVQVGETEFINVNRLLEFRLAKEQNNKEKQR